jgi:hypothetical protein
MRLISGSGTAFRIGHLIDRIEVEKLLWRDKRIMRRHEADEDNPRLLQSGGVAQPRRGDIGHAPVVARILGFAGARAFRDRRTPARGRDEIRKLLPDGSCRLRR